MQSVHVTFNMKQNRRGFLTQLGVLAVGATILPSVSCVASNKAKTFGIQLYSLREELPNNVEQVISKIASAGYSSVETFGYSKEHGFWGLSPEAFKKMLDKYRLKCPTGHYDFGIYQKKSDLQSIHEYIEVAKTLGTKYIVIPSLNPNIYKDEKRTNNWIKQLNVAAEVINAAGLKLAYHNHNIEFYDLGGGKTAYDIMLNATDPNLVDFEMDLYWIFRAKRDPLKLFKDHPGRFKLWHIKDVNKSDHTRNTEIGNGIIDFKPIFKEAKLAGLEYPIMEQENFEIDPFESIHISAKYLKKHLI